MISHYRKKCIGCGACAMQCPKYWQMSSLDGKADLKEAVEKKNKIFCRQEDAEDRENIELTAQLCPVNIIKVQ